MFRQLLEEAFEEFKQTVAPARPEISTPRPPGSFPSFPASPVGPEAEPIQARTPAPAAPVQTRVAPAARPPAPARVSSVHGLRARLGSRESVRSAFIMMEVLRPPVALRESIDPMDDR